MKRMGFYTKVSFENIEELSNFVQDGKNEAFYREQLTDTILPVLDNNGTPCLDTEAFQPVESDMLPLIYGYIEQKSDNKVLDGYAMINVLGKHGYSFIMNCDKESALELALKSELIDKEDYECANVADVYEDDIKALGFYNVE